MYMAQIFYINVFKRRNSDAEPRMEKASHFGGYGRHAGVFYLDAEDAAKDLREGYETQELYALSATDYHHAAPVLAGDV